MKDEVQTVFTSSFILHPSSLLDSRRVGLGRLLARLPVRRAFERLDGARLVKVEHGVELFRKSRVEVMARALGLRAVKGCEP